MLTPNTLLQNRYLVLQSIGRGGMGAVYKATDMRLHCTVALKQTLLNERAQRRAFEREAMLLARLRHPVLPKVIDHFSENDGQFLVMEFIGGDDLATLLARNGGKFPSQDVLSWALRWADQLLDALHYLHTQSPPIIHRDIKPQNLKLTPRGDIILLDFGLARAGLSQHSTVTAVDSQGVAGYTPSYAPLEQVRGAEPDPRSDLYSLAATLYHLLTGERPPDALSRVAALVNNQPDPLRPASEINRGVPAAIAEVLHVALAINSDGRHQSAARMRKALRTAATAPAAEPAHVADDATIIMMPSALAPARPVAPPTAPAARAGTLLRTLSAGTPVLALALSPNGEFLATGGEDRAVTLWRASDGHQLRTLDARVRSVQSVAFSSDDQLLAAGSEDKTLCIWRVVDGSPVELPEVRANYPAECVTFSPDRRLLASGGWGGSISLWHINDGAVIWRSSLVSGFVQSLAFSPDGQVLAAGCYDGTVSLWQVSDDADRGSTPILRTLEGLNNFVLSVAFSPDGRLLATAGGSPLVRIWRVRDGRLIETLHGHTNYVRSVAFSPDAETLASASEDRSVRIWRVSDGALCHTLADHGGGVTSVAFSPDGRLLASGSRDGKIRFWQVRD